jgi:sulfatase modifying factor 1
MKSFLQSLPGSTISFKMVKVERGAFDMGGESWNLGDSLPVHRVELSEYWMGIHPVTQELWEAVMGAGKNESFFKGKQRPVDSISWDDANNNFLPALNELSHNNRPSGTIFQLPTEAQWEYAARGGGMNTGFLYSGSNKLDEVGWYDENSHRETKPVGLKLPNELGLYDMSCNVWEWCRDWYAGDYYKKCKQRGVVKDPGGPGEGDFRVLRGGSWSNDPQNCRVSTRGSTPPRYRLSSAGFRLVLVSLPV